MVLKPQATYFDFIQKKKKKVFKGECLQGFRGCTFSIFCYVEKRPEKSKTDKNKKGIFHAT